MSNAKHTPGPWHAVDQFGDMEIFVSSIHGQVATCEEHKGVWKATAKANAHLIAAAPELLEALEEMWRVFNASNAQEAEASLRPVPPSSRLRGSNDSHP